MRRLFEYAQAYTWNHEKPGEFNQREEWEFYVFEFTPVWAG